MYKCMYKHYIIYLCTLNRNIMYDYLRYLARGTILPREDFACNTFRPCTADELAQLAPQ